MIFICWNRPSLPGLLFILRITCFTMYHKLVNGYDRDSTIKRLLAYLVGLPHWLSFHSLHCPCAQQRPWWLVASYIQPSGIASDLEGRLLAVPAKGWPSCCLSASQWFSSLHPFHRSSSAVIWTFGGFYWCRSTSRVKHGPVLNVKSYACGFPAVKSVYSRVWQMYD